jgi:hypothetical protein
MGKGMADSGNRTGAGTGTDEPQSPWLRSGFVLAAAFIGFVAVIGVVVMASSSDSSGQDRRSNAASASRTGTPQPEGDGGSGEAPASGTGDANAKCPQLPDKQQKALTEAPSGVSWDLFKTVALPSSKAAGPAVAGKDVARCYAHSPLGALLATSQISVRYLAADNWLKVTREQLVGSGRRPYIDARTKSEKSGEASEMPDGDEGGRGRQGQIAGFKFVTYTDTTAVIQVVWRFPDGKMQAATTTVLWRNGDWRLEYPAEPAAPTPVDSLAGYVNWGGV